MIEEKKPNYKIWHFGKTKWDRVVDERFYAENDEGAYTYLKAFKKMKELNDVDYYYSSIHYICLVDGNGNKSPEFDISDREFSRKWIYKNDSFFKKIWSKIKFEFSYWFVECPKDLRYKIRDLRYLLKYKEAYSNQWNLDWHLLDSIERNVPSLIENSYALAFIDEAIMKLHENEPRFNLDAYHKEHCCGYPKEVEDLAMKIQKDEYKNLLLYVKLYKYYASNGYVDFENQEEVEFDKKWRYTLPIKSGTYDEISDYKKLVSLSKEYWNKIWDWMKAYGDKLND